MSRKKQLLVQFLCASMAMCIVILSIDRINLTQNNYFHGNRGQFQKTASCRDVLADMMKGHWNRNLTESERSEIDQTLKNRRIDSFLASFQRDERKPIEKIATCRNVLSGMLKGHWISRRLTESERSEIEQAIQDRRAQYSLPATMQRDDGKCGNITFKAKNFFRALCNPKGDKPCCFESECVAASEEQCRCKNCYDLRQQIHAEYSTWIPTDSSCLPYHYSVDEACRLLKGSTLYFIGDSLVRQLFFGLVYIMTEGFKDFPDVSDKCKSYAAGMDKRCSLNFYQSLTFCNKTAKAVYKTKRKIPDVLDVQEVLEGLSGTKQSLAIIGIGIWENYNSSKTIDYILKPLVNYLRKSKPVWPKFLWCASHAPGVLKTPRIPQQNYESVLRYNRHISKYLAPWNIPIFDTFNLTDGTVSYDGTHYGLGVNMMKIQIILNYLQEERNKGRW